MPNQTIFNLLRSLRGGGFNTSLVLPNGVVINNQKVVAFDTTGGTTGNTVFTVSAAGVARATNIGSINSVDF